MKNSSLSLNCRKALNCQNPINSETILKVKLFPPFTVQKLYHKPKSIYRKSQTDLSQVPVKSVFEISQVKAVELSQIYIDLSQVHVCFNFVASPLFIYRKSHTSPQELDLSQDYCSFIASQLSIYRKSLTSPRGLVLSQVHFITSPLIASPRFILSVVIYRNSNSRKSILSRQSSK